MFYSHRLRVDCISVLDVVIHTLQGICFICKQWQLENLLVVPGFEIAKPGIALANPGIAIAKPGFAIAKLDFVGFAISKILFNLLLRRESYTTKNFEFVCIRLAS